MSTNIIYTFLYTSYLHTVVIYTQYIYTMYLHNIYTGEHGAGHLLPLLGSSHLQLNQKRTWPSSQENSELTQFKAIMLCFKNMIITALFQAAKRGLVMINFFSYFITCSNASTITDVIGEISFLHNIQHGYQLTIRSLGSWDIIINAERYSLDWKISSDNE